MKKFWLLVSDVILCIVVAYKSPTFKTAILSDRFYHGFALPDYLR
jgi:hypothetical protein